MNRVEFCRTLDRAAALLPDGNPERRLLHETRASLTTTDGNPETAWLQLLGIRQRLTESRTYPAAVDLIHEALRLLSGDTAAQSSAENP